MNFLKKIFGGLDQRGVIHLIPLFLLLAGIIVGVYLVQKEGFQLFKPKAAGETVEFLPGNCVKVNKEGKQVLVCDQFQMKIRSPLETGQTTDATSKINPLANMSLVKTAYAGEADTGDINGIGSVCDDRDNTKVYGRDLFGNQTPASSCEDGYTCHRIGTGFLNSSRSYCANGDGVPVVQGSGWNCQNNKIHKDGISFAFFNFLEININCPQNYTCDKQGERLTCIPEGTKAPGGARAPVTSFKPANSSPGQQGEVTEVTINTNQTALSFSWSTSENVKNYRLIIDAQEDGRVAALNDCGDRYSSYYICTTTSAGTDSIRSSRFKDGATYTWWVDAVPVEGEPVPSDGFDIKIKKQAPLAPPAGGNLPPAAAAPAAGGAPVTGAAPASNCQSGQAGSVTAAQAQCVLNLRSDVLTAYKSFGWCTQEIDKPGVVNDWYNKLAGPTDKQQVSNCFSGNTPAGGGIPPLTECTIGPTGTVTATQAKCVVDLRTDIVTYYKSNGWCADESSYPAIVNNWMSINSAADKQQVANCLTAAPASQAKITTKFRLATNPTDLETATWFDYTPGGVTVNVPSPQFTLGVPSLNTTQSIYVQFRDNNLQIIKFSTGNDFTIVNIDFVDITTIPGATTPNPPAGNIPAGSDCSAYETTSVCGDNQKTYDKCTDNLGQTDNQLCSGRATTFYCEGSTNSNCISNPARVGNYDCSACPNLKDRASGGDGGNSQSLVASCSVVPVSVEVNQPVTFNIGATRDQVSVIWGGDVNERVETSNGVSTITKSFSTPGYKQVFATVVSGSNTYLAQCVTVNVRSASSSNIPAGSACSAYETTSVCGGGFTTYDKCTDDLGQRGSSLCAGSATQFYCEGSTNSNCISSTTRTPHYSCSGCPNLSSR